MNMGEKITEDEILDMIQQADCDGDGQISFEGKDVCRM